MYLYLVNPVYQSKQITHINNVHEIMHSRLQDPLARHYPSTEAHHIDSSSASAHPHIVELKPPLSDHDLPPNKVHWLSQYTPFPLPCRPIKCRYATEQLYHRT